MLVAAGEDGGAAGAADGSGGERVVEHGAAVRQQGARPGQRLRPAQEDVLVVSDDQQDVGSGGGRHAGQQWEQPHHSAVPGAVGLLAALLVFLERANKTKLSMYSSHQVFSSN